MKRSTELPPTRAQQQCVQEQCVRVGDRVAGLLGAPRPANAQVGEVGASLGWDLRVHTVLVLGRPTGSLSSDYLCVLSADSFAEPDDAKAGADRAIEQHLHEHSAVAVAVIETWYAHGLHSTWRAHARAVHDLSGLRDFDALLALLARWADVDEAA